MPYTNYTLTIFLVVNLSLVKSIVLNEKIELLLTLVKTIGDNYKGYLLQMS